MMHGVTNIKIYQVECLSNTISLVLLLNCYNFREFALAMPSTISWMQVRRLFLASEKAGNCAA